MVKNQTRLESSDAAAGGLGESRPEPALDRFFVSRLLLGALSEHEQRRLLVRLLRADAALRREIEPFLAPFVAEDHEPFARFEAALASGVAAEVARVSLLEKESEARLESLIRDFTFQDLFQLGGASRRVFSWSMAELLLRRAQRGDVDLPSRRTSFFMATTVTDGLDILAAAGVLPPYPRALADLRGRLQGIGAALRSNKSRAR